MKLKYLFIALASSLCLFASCEKEEATSLDSIKLDKTYLSIPAGGGNATLTIDAKEAWSFAEDIVLGKDDNKNNIYGQLPAWLKASTLSGGAGKATVTFSADPIDGGREQEMHILVGDGETKTTQYIIVRQGSLEAVKASCKEVLEGADGKTFTTTGTCTSIANTNYGNWYLNDGTGEVYIYGTVDATGSYNWASFGIEVGDVVTVQGPKTTYNGTVELVDVTVVKINKSLMKVEEVKYINEDPEVTDCLDVPGGYVSFLLSNKGNGLYVDVPSDAAGWLSINSVAGDVVIFSATANEGGDRETNVTFRTVSGGKDYTATATIKQKGAIIACTVAEFLAAEVGNTQYRLTGVISRDYPSDKQGQSFYIKDWSGETLVYRVDNFKESGLQVGDVVTVRGKRGAYKDSPQMVNGTIEAVVEIVDEATIPEVLAAADGAWFRVTGEVKSIANETYGNIYITDGTNELYIYGCYPGYGATGDARKGVVAAEGIKEGDMLTVFGPKSTYKGTPQINGGIFWSLTPAN